MRLTTDEMIAIKENLFTYGVILVEDVVGKPHPEINICQQKVKAFLKTMISRKHVTKSFAFSHGYYKLTKEGVEYLRKNLCVKDGEMPLTHSQVVREVLKTDNLKIEEEN